MSYANFRSDHHDLNNNNNKISIKYELWRKHCEIIYSVLVSFYSSLVYLFLPFYSWIMRPHVPILHFHHPWDTSDYRSWETRLPKKNFSVTKHTSAVTILSKCIIHMDMIEDLLSCQGQVMNIYLSVTPLHRFATFLPPLCDQKNQDAYWLPKPMKSSSSVPVQHDPWAFLETAKLHRHNT